MTTYKHHDPDVGGGTIRAYGFGWRRYVGWCDAEGRDPWHDPDGSTFAAFVVAEVRAGRKPNTISQCRAAITYRYRTDPSLYGLADPAKSDAVVAEMKRLTRRARGQRVAKAPPLLPDMMEQVVAVSAIRRAREGAQRAIERHLEFEATVRLMFDSALRCDDMVRSEWAHVSTEANGGGFRALYVPPGKTPHDRYGNISPKTWSALQRWRAISPTPDGRISTARSAKALAERVRRAGAFAGVEISGHSPRRGVLTAAARNGATEFELMAIAGHKSPSMVYEYTDQGDAADNAVAKLYDEPDPEPEGDPWMDGAAHAFGLVDAFAAEAQTQLLARLEVHREHPVAVEVWAELRDVWPAPEPPRYCAREGCAGGVGFTVGSGSDAERWCSERCRTRQHTPVSKP